MKHLLLILSVTVSLTCIGQNKENSVLWKISGNGLKESSYLFGTIHAIPEKQFVISDSISNHLEASKTLILEIDPNIPIGEQVKLAKRMFLPKGETIKNYLDSSQFEKLHSYLKDSLKLAEAKINRYFMLKPVFMQTMIMMEFIEKPMTFEKELRDLAGKKKNFVPLETLDEQMNLLDGIPLENQVSFNSDNYKLDKEYFGLLDLYLNQDLRGIDSLMFSDPDFKKIEYDLLTKRNFSWIPKIKQSISDGSTFVAVGCAHLIGDNGLITLLRNEGYTVEPISFKN